MKTCSDLRFGDSFARLPEAFHRPVRPRPLPDPVLVAVSEPACRLLDLDPACLERPEALRWFSGAEVPPGSRPLAATYAGHQFGHFVPRLGDGRAVLLGDLPARDGRRWDVQLKGAGRTPFSRDGDGRAVLRSSIREFLCSEAMAALGIPTTRALCLIGGSEPVWRERAETAAVVTRLAPGFVRFGSFEQFYHEGRFDLLRRLGEHVLDRHYPELRETPRPFEALFREVVARTARLIARWQAIGFAHGVLNTDNLSMLGLTLDYGPFGFMEAWDPGWVCNHSDVQGRYAFDRQPSIGLWNLTCLAQAMLPLFDAEDGEAAAGIARDLLAAYEPAFRAAWAEALCARLGLSGARDDDVALGADLLARMAAQGADLTRVFRALCEVRRDDASGDAAARACFRDPAAFDAWAEDYRARLRAEGRDDAERRAAMRAVNPRYVLRNWIAQQAIERAENGDFSEVRRVLRVLERPFDDQPEAADLDAPAPDWARGLAVSCSS